jgi:uncharacterized protein
MAASEGRVALLDVNLLVALFFPGHTHHEVAHDWFADHGAHGWATCAVTENGFVRVACQISSAEAHEEILRPVTALDHFRRFCAGRHHRDWHQEVSLRDPKLFAPKFIGGHRQITDVYLLGLAKKMGGRLATFDRTIPLQAVRGATPDLLQVIGPAD